MPIIASLVCIPPFPSILLGSFLQQLPHSQEMQFSFYNPSQTEWGEPEIHCILQAPDEWLLDYLPLGISHTWASLILWIRDR